MVKERLKKVLNHAWLHKSKNAFEDLFAPWLSTEWGQRASWIALILFGIFFIVTVLVTGVNWYHDITMTSHSTASSYHETNDGVTQSIAQIPDQHLFGKFGVADQNGLPITSLQLHLVGVIKGNSENDSRVIISESGQPAKVYGVGDNLPSGITIHAISQDGVILENSGRLEKLPLQRKPLVFQGMPKPLSDGEE